MKFRYRNEKEMKDSSIEWVGNIPVNWGKSKMKYIKSPNKNSFVDGPFGSNLKSEHFIEDGEIYVIESNFATQGELDEKNIKRISKKHFETIKRSEVKFGDIVIAKIGAQFGLSNILPEISKRAVVSGNSLKLTVDKRIVDNKYLHYQLISIKKNSVLDLIVSITAQPALSLGDMNNIDIILPSLEMQSKVVKFLDEKTAKFDTIILKKEQLIKRLEESKKSLINEVVTGKVKVVKTNDTYGLEERNKEEMKESEIEWLGNIPKEWEVKGIKRLSYIGRGASPRPIDNPEYFDENGEYAWTRISDVTATDKFLIHTSQKTSRLGASLSVKLEPNSLFLSIAGSVGKPCITGVKACIHDGFVYFPDLEESYVEYLYFVFLGGQCYKGLGKLGTQLNLNRETVGNIKIATPKLKKDIEEITLFLDIKLNELTVLIDKTKKQIEKIKKAKQSLISEAVTGKIEILE